MYELHFFLITESESKSKEQLALLKTNKSKQTIDMHKMWNGRSYNKLIRNKNQSTNSKN